MGLSDAAATTYSGSMERPGLEVLLRAVEAGRTGVVLTEDVSRTDLRIIDAELYAYAHRRCSRGCSRHVWISRRLAQA